MVDKASRKFGDEVSTDTEETLQTLVEHLHGCSNQEAEPDNPRMDQLLCHLRHEMEDVRGRCPSSYHAAQSDMETMEDPSETSVGIKEIRHR